MLLSKVIETKTIPRSLIGLFDKKTYINRWEDTGQKKYNKKRLSSRFLNTIAKD